MLSIAFKLRRASTGLGLLLLGLLISVAMQVLLVVVILAANFGQMNAAAQAGKKFQPAQNLNLQGNGAIVLVGAAAMFLTMGRTIDLIGQFRCLVLVGEFPGAKFLSASLFFQVLAFAGTCWEAIAQNGILPPPPVAVQVEQVTAGISSQVCFLLFLFGLAHYIQRTDLAIRAKAILIQSIVTVVLGGICFGMMQQFPGLSLPALMCMVYMVSLFLRYLRLIGGLRVATARFADALEAHLVSVSASDEVRD